MESARGPARTADGPEDAVAEGGIAGGPRLPGRMGIDGIPGMDGIGVSLIGCVLGGVGVSLGAGAAVSASVLLSQYFAAVLILASAAMRKTPEVATRAPGASPDNTSYIPLASVPI